MRVDVYRNLHANSKDEIWSIKSMERGHKYGRVIGHSGFVSIVNAEPVIHQSGLKRFKEEGVKNVHAFIRGHMMDEKKRDHFDGEEIYYDGNGHFRYQESDKSFNNAELVYFCHSGVFVK